MSKRSIPAAAMVIAFIIGMGGVVPASAQVVLSATSSKATYRVGEHIAIVLTLTNRGGAPVALSSIDMGSVTITALTRNGVSVVGRNADIRLDEELGTALTGSLQSVARDRRLSITMESTIDPLTGNVVLRSVRYVAAQPPKATLYAVAQPGSYRLSVVYQFPAIPGVPAATYLGKTNTANVSFRVQ